MMKLAMSPAAAALLRALLGRAGVDRNRILLTDFRSTDWRSLTFAGERHRMDLRIPGPAAGAVAELLTQGLGERSFPSPGISSPTSPSKAPWSSTWTERSACGWRH
jgi:hypothetical protein